MSPPPLALRPLLDEEVNWRLKAEAMVGSFSVLEEEPVGELAVEGGQVVEQQVFMIVHELFLEGAVEAFRVGVHFRGAGVRPPVRDAAFLQAVLEVAEERRAVVGEHVAWGDWQEMAQGGQRRGIPASLGDPSASSDRGYAGSPDTHRGWPPRRAWPRTRESAVGVEHRWESCSKDARIGLFGKTPGCGSRGGGCAWHSSWLGVPKVSELIQHSGTIILK